MSASLQPAPAIVTDRRPGPELRVRVGIVGATGYVGAELVRLLARHPFVEIVGLTARSRSNEGSAGRIPISPRPASRSTQPRPRTSMRSSSPCPTARPPRSSRPSPLPARPSSTWAPTSASGTPPTTPAGTASTTPPRSSSTTPSTAFRSSTARSSKRCARRRGPSSARPGATRRRRSSPSLPSPGPASSATSSSTPRAASRVPAATPSPT